MRPNTFPYRQIKRVAVGAWGRRETMGVQVDGMGYFYHLTADSADLNDFIF